MMENLQYYPEAVRNFLLAIASAGVGVLYSIACIYSGLERLVLYTHMSEMAQNKAEGR